MQLIRVVFISPSYTKANQDEIVVQATQAKDFIRRNPRWRVRLLMYSNGTGEHTWRWTNDEIKEALNHLADEPFTEGIGERRSIHERPPIQD